MDKFNDDMNTLKQIRLISSSILEHFNKLSRLDHEGKKDSIEFAKAVELLQMSLGLENNLYSSLSTNINILKRLREQNFSQNEKFNNADILETANDVLIRKRIDIRIATIIDNIYSEYARNNNDDISVHVYGNEYLVSLNGLNKLERAIVLDTINTFLVILNTCLEREEYQAVINKILDMKYKLGFVYKDIEQSFLENNFIVSDEIYLTKDFYKGIFRIEYDIVDFILRETINELFNLTNDESMFGMVKDEVVFRTSLVLADSELYIVLLDSLETNAKKSKLIEYKDAFNKLLEFHKKDMNRVNNISFGLK